MCYAVKARTEMALRIARTRGDRAAAERLERLLHPAAEHDLHFANAFTHPRLVVYTGALPREPQLAQWGLVPAWVKDEAARDRLWNRTLNARGETMLEKPAFRHAARSQRCLVHVEGFYEHYHLGRSAHPFFIRLRDRPFFALAALWEAWNAPGSATPVLTFAIVTCPGNGLLARIHNKPGPHGPRMPVILAEEEEDLWLEPLSGPASEAALSALLKPYPAEAMAAHPVRPLLGRGGLGNAPGISDPYDNPALALAGPLA